MESNLEINQLNGKYSTLRHKYTTCLKPTQASENAWHIRSLIGKHHLPQYCESALLYYLTCTDSFLLACPDWGDIVREEVSPLPMLVG